MSSTFNKYLCCATVDELLLHAASECGPAVPVPANDQEQGTDAGVHVLDGLAT